MGIERGGADKGLNTCRIAPLVVAVVCARTAHVDKSFLVMFGIDNFRSW